MMFIFGLSGITDYKTRGDSDAELYKKEILTTVCVFKENTVLHKLFM